jgi:hypothetical protein
MNAEVLRILTACDPESRKHYPTTLFDRDGAFVGPVHCKDEHILCQYRSWFDDRSIYQIPAPIAN